MTTNTKRRRPRGSAWYWKQTDTWYYTPPSTKSRVPLVDEAGTRIRGEQLRGLLALVVLGVCGKFVFDLFATPADPYSLVLVAGGMP